MNDLISRQAAIDVFEKELSVKYNRRELAIGFTGIKSILEKLPSAQQWIPVSERLPERSGLYIASGGGEAWICEFTKICTVCGWVNDCRKPSVKAWMPLPKPWRGEEDGELA